MKIGIAVIGTRGDLQPYIVLARALNQAGYRARVFGPPNFGDLAASLGVEYEGFGVNWQDAFSHPDTQQLLEGDLFFLPKIWDSIVLKMLDSGLEACKRAAEWGDALLYHATTVGGPDIAEATGKPVICTALQPVTTPTGLHPLPSVPLFQMQLAQNLGPIVNRATFLSWRAQRLLFYNRIGRWRKRELGLSSSGPMFPRVAQGSMGLLPRLHLVSPQISAIPDDTETHLYTTGYAFLDSNEEETLDPQLEDFLESGPTPIYVGFGGASLNDTERFTNRVMEGLRSTGVRAVVATGWGGLQEAETDDNFLFVNYVPFDKLFPRVKAIVHHCSAGTFGRILYFGKPMLNVPFSFDMPWFGARGYEMGVAPKPILARRLKTDVFARRLNDLLSNSRYSQTAEEIGQKMRLEDGNATAVKRITTILDAKSKNG